jgi:hypothetical protein
MNEQVSLVGRRRQPKPEFPAGASRLFALLVLSFTAVGARAQDAVAPKQPGDAATTVDFADDIRPLLAKHCGECHGPDARESGLRLDVRSDALRGGDSGRVIIPGKSADSLLVERITSSDPVERMPPEKPLSADQVSLLKAWIDQGAIWPEADAALAGSSTHWSFQPIVRPDLPAVRNRRWPRGGVDRFVLARLEQFGIEPSPEADRPTLIRRLCLDLTGLPPTPAEVLAFAEDTRPDAYERLVERLLASPHFGECWGLHWLDLARYADSDGYEMDHFRPNAWRWRDWVVAAINADMPFDQFTIEQLAGDLLPQATLQQKIATGFHRNTLTNRENGIDKEEFRQKAIVDRVNTTGTVWLGLTIGCAECHSHKYDPILQREYYQLFSFYNDRVDEADIEIPRAGDAVAHGFAARDKSRVTRVHLRGNFLDPGERVRPGTPAVLPPLPSPEDGGAADRLDLARWLVDPQNPLTARVEANRVWQHLFGIGLVTTEGDFGAQGEPPSHPELLDWLARELVRCDWSRKELIRLIVTSATYRQSSDHRLDLSQRDPLNRLLARQNRYRLDAELVRDQYLAVSGLLNQRVGGPGFRPPLPDALAKIGFKLSWEPDEGAELYRRSMYIRFMRNMAYPMLTTFDRTDANVTCTRRERSNTPLQSLTQLNDPLFMEAARALGLYLINEIQGDDARIDAALMRAVARRPSAEERRVLLRLHKRLLRLYRDDADGGKAVVGDADVDNVAEAAAWIALARTILNLDEFITRE